METKQFMCVRSFIGEVKGVANQPVTLTKAQFDHYSKRGYVVTMKEYEAKFSKKVSPLDEAENKAIGDVQTKDMPVIPIAQAPSKEVEEEEEVVMVNTAPEKEAEVVEQKPEKAAKPAKK